MNKRQLGIRIPNNLLERLDNYAVEHNISKTDVVIGALAKYLESPESIPFGERIIAVEARVTKLEAQLNKMETLN